MTDTQFPDGPVPVEEMYQPKDAVGEAIKSTLVTGGAGLFAAAIQSTMSKRNVGAFAVFTHFGSTIAIFAGTGGAYSFVQTASGNLRHTDDAWNYAYGGAVAGAIAGLRTLSFPKILGLAAATGTALGVAKFTGSTLQTTTDLHMQEGRWPTKEEMRKRFRRPANETINELGEGRGIYGPGYDERRAQRLKENYNIDVPKPFWGPQTNS